MIKNNMNKAEFANALKAKTRKVEEKMNVKFASFFAVSSDGMMDHTTLDNAISELYDLYKDGEDYLVLRSEIGLGSSDKWIEIDFVQAHWFGNKNNGRWSVTSIVVLYTDDGAEETVLAEF